MLGKKLQEFIYYYKKKGIRDTAKRILAKYTKILSFTIYKGSLNEDIDGPTLENKYKTITDDIEFLKNVRSKRDDLPREFYIDITHNGKRFYLVSLGDEPAYIVWVFGKGEFSRFCIFSNEKTVEFAYGYTMPSFRGQKLYSKTMNYACQDLKEKGHETVVGVISSGNVNCHKAIQYTILKKYASIKSYFSFNKKIRI